MCPLNNFTIICVFALLASIRTNDDGFSCNPDSNPDDVSYEVDCKNKLIDSSTEYSSINFTTPGSLIEPTSSQSSIAVDNPNPGANLSTTIEPQVNLTTESPTVTKSTFVTLGTTKIALSKLTTTTNTPSTIKVESNISIESSTKSPSAMSNRIHQLPTNHTVEASSNQSSSTPDFRNATQSSLNATTRIVPNSSSSAAFVANISCVLILLAFTCYFL